MKDAASEFVLVQNKTARILGPSYKEKAGPAILRLKPGINKVKREAWEQAKKTKLARHHIDHELLLELGDRPELPVMPLTRALAVVENTLDKALLRSYTKGESRKPVLDAIEKQLVKLDGSKPDKDEDEEGAPAEISASSPLQPVGGGVDVSAPRGRGKGRK